MFSRSPSSRPTQGPNFKLQFSRTVMKYFQANCQILIEAAKNCTLVLSMRVNINIKLLTKEKIKQVMT